MKVIGLTGGIASGKSTVSSILKELGAVIIDVDIIARNVVEIDEIAYNKIVQYFGEDILLPNKELDRKKLGSIVFSDKQKLETLNNITHPEILVRIREELQKCRESGEKAVVIDAAILIEMGLDKLTDSVWVITVSKDIQIKRLIERDKLSYEQALNRVNSQLLDEQRLRYADVVIDNNKEKEEVKRDIKEKWNKYLGEVSS